MGISHLYKFYYPLKFYILYKLTIKLGVRRQKIKKTPGSEIAITKII